MAETNKGTKYVEVQKYSYIKKDGKKVTVPRHDRSTPKTSKGKRK
jgi:hypothetical protein